MKSMHLYKKIHWNAFLKSCWQIKGRRHYEVALEILLPVNNRVSLVVQMVKNLPAMWETWVWSLSQEDPLEKELATHSSILAWIIPWIEEPGRLEFMGSQRVRHDWSNLACSTLIMPRITPVCLGIPTFRSPVFTGKVLSFQHNTCLPWTVGERLWAWVTRPGPRLHKVY